jgi:hypothetical protein
MFYILKDASSQIQCISEDNQKNIVSSEKYMYILIYVAKYSSITIKNKPFFHFISVINIFAGFYKQNSLSRSHVSNSSNVVSGVAHSDKIPDYRNLSNLLNKKSDFKIIEKHKPGVNSIDMSVKILPDEVIKLDRAEQ